jgi:hypothetical protein
MEISSAVIAFRFIKTCSEIPSEYIALLTELFSSPSSSFTHENLQQLFDYFSSSTKWEYVAFSLLLSIYLLKSSSSHSSYSPQIIQSLHLSLNNYLDHQEPRVRQITCQLIGLIVEQRGYEEYLFFYTKILQCVQQNSERRCQTRPVVLGEMKELELDEVTGWKALETSYNAFKELVKGFRQHLFANPSLLFSDSDTDCDSDLLTWRSCRIAPIGSRALQIFILDAGVHINRYVRQSCCELIDIMCQGPPPQSSLPSSPSCSFPVSGPSVSSATSPFFTQDPPPEVIVALRNVLAIGLQDSWCQVRLAATLALNSFLTQLTPYSSLESLVWPLLLPRLCLNRHYSTDSVKEIAQMIWQTRLGPRGRELLTQHMASVTAYYLSMTRHKNHIVCEAACSAIAELISRISSSTVDASLSLMLVTLRDSLIDASWPVRDRACIAIGRCLRSIWDRNIDMTSAVEIRIISLPSVEEIIHCQSQAEKGDEVVLEKEGDIDESQLEQDKKPLTVMDIVQESVEILFLYLHSDPFRPVRESAAIALVDCLLPPLSPLGSCENPLKVCLYSFDISLSLLSVSCLSLVCLLSPLLTLDSLSLDSLSLSLGVSLSVFLSPLCL